MADTLDVQRFVNECNLLLAALRDGLSISEREREVLKGELEQLYRELYNKGHEA